MRASHVLAAVAVLAPALALANGRAPVTNGIAFRPGDARSIYVRTTFGLLISHDDGCTFRWVCEQAIGYGGQYDPTYRIAADGTIYATTFTGLRVSRDDGCTWQTVTPEVWVDALDLGPTGDVWIATAESGVPNDLFRSTDGGTTFVPRGMQSPEIWWKSVRVAPTRAERVYATGYQVAPQATPHLVITDDAGASWRSSALAGVMYGSTPVVFASAIDPANADVVFLTSLGANAPAGDRLCRSIDAGATFTEVLATTAPIDDIVFHRGKVIVATGAGGSFESTTGGASFAPMADPPQLGCLGEHDGQLVGCGTNWDPDFKAVARSGDGAAWNKLFRFVELAGPLECPGGTTAFEQCDAQWPSLQQQFGATGPTCGVAEPDTTPPPGGGCCDAGTPAGAGALAGWSILLLRRRRRPAR
jgi:hypothetical protein